MKDPRSQLFPFFADIQQKMFYIEDVENNEVSNGYMINGSSVIF